jgi:hypothetical protein
MAVMLSASRTGRALLFIIFFLFLVLVSVKRLSEVQGHSSALRIRHEINYITRNVL